MRFDYHDSHLKATMKIKDDNLWTTGRSVCFSFRLTMATLFVGFIYKVCYFPYA